MLGVWHLNLDIALHLGREQLLREVGPRHEVDERDPVMCRFVLDEPGEEQVSRVILVRRGGDRVEEAEGGARVAHRQDERCRSTVKEEPVRAEVTVRLGGGHQAPEDRGGGKVVERRVPRIVDSAQLVLTGPMDGLDGAHALRRDRRRHVVRNADAILGEPTLAAVEHAKKPLLARRAVGCPAAIEPHHCLLDRVLHLNEPGERRAQGLAGRARVRHEAEVDQVPGATVVEE